MRIVGLDLSLTATGFCLLYPAPQSDIRCGVFKPKNKQEMPRLWEVYQFASSLCEDHHPDLVVIEGFAFNRGNQAHQIGGLGYLVRMKLWRMGQRFIIVAPAQLKKFATGKGNADKQIIIREVWRLWGVEVNDDNAADAVVLAQIGLGVMGAGTWKSHQREVLEKLAVAN